jgi:hypothetical protein
MTHIAGILTFAMIAFGMLTSCDRPSATPDSHTIIILPDG